MVGEGRLWNILDGTTNQVVCDGADWEDPLISDIYIRLMLTKVFLKSVRR